ncbi:cellulose-binding family ii [Venturia nashicola]|uniref:Cellulose-binding family ii n=1 Tax=Venturia nashicola TaxID=86259 RepID=A0A4Z1P1J3_9PEZI|nr:cellulose-binding family ii [Venturia nashicola]TLD34705.1 cellulose-binding family ii [Venturia nashicola]
MVKTVILAFAFAVAALADHGSTYYFEDAGLVNHTLYQPLQSAFGKDSLKLPVIVWGNGACVSQGLRYRGFLGEIASHGALLIATGPAAPDLDTHPRSNRSTGGSQPNPGALTQAIDWVVANAGKGLYAHVDSSRLAVWGQSCGGLETYTAASNDDRVNFLGIFNSGQMSANASLAVAGSLKKPVFYFLGGPKDTAYKNGMRDYSYLPKTTPAFLGSHDKGHSAAFDDLNAGIVGNAGTQLLQWLLRGNETGKAWFTEGGWKTSGFVNATFQNLEGLATPSAI